MRPAANLLAIALLTLLAGAQEKGEPGYSKVPEPPSPEAIAARDSGIKTAWTRALNVAHQLSVSQGYRRRDARWIGTLSNEEGRFTIIPLQLYAGNDYYLVLGTDIEADSIAAAAFDPDRMLINVAPDRGSGKLVLRVKPGKSGTHYLRIHLKQRLEKPAHCALTYIYK